MRLAKLILNLILICVTFVLVTLAEFTIYNLIALPAGSNSTIAFVSQDTNDDGHDDNVSYFDTFAFLGDDLKESVTREPRYMIRSWFKWDWWQNGMKWADVAAEAVVGVCVPIFAPVYEINEIKYYYTSDTPIKGNIGNEYEVYGLYVLTDEEVGFIDKKSTTYNPEFIETFNETKKTTFAYAEFTNGIGDGNDRVSGGGIYKIENGEIKEVITWSKYGDAANYSSSAWKKENNSFINVLLKLNKYNSVNEDGTNVYIKWKYKFMDENGVIKSSTSSLYFQFYLAVVISIWFCYQNHFVVDRDEYGGLHIGGGFRHRKPKQPKYDDDGNEVKPRPRRHFHRPRFFRRKRK